MRHQPITDEHLKKNAPIWKRLLRPSMPEWTPMKVAVTATLAVTILLTGLLFIPKQTTRDFKSESVTTKSFEFSAVKLAAFDGLRTTIVEQSNTSTSSSSDRGILVTGQIKNTTKNEIFILLDIRTSSSSSREPGSYRSDRLTMEIPGLELTKNWNQIRGYFIKPNEEQEFHLLSARMEISTSKQFDLGFVWNYVNLETLEQLSDLSEFTFHQTGNSWAFGESEILWKRPNATYHPELRVPERPR